LSQPAAHRLRFLLGLFLASGLGVGLSQALLGEARREIASAGDRRRAVVTLRALSQVIERAGSRGDKVRQVVTAWAGGAPPGAAIRVLLVDDLSLEASTAPGDVGEKAAPRRLERAEKPLFDRGQRLRDAVDTNKEEGSARKAELEVELLSAGGLSLATPLEEGGAVVGMVQLETPPPAGGPGANAGGAFAAWLLPVLALAALSFALKDRRAPLAVASALLLAASLGFTYVDSVRTLEQDRHAAEAALSAHIRAELARAGEQLAQLGVAAEPPLAPSTLDVDRFRKPREMLSAAGEPDESRLAAEIQVERTQAAQAIGLIALVSLALLFFVGLGGASAFFGALSTHRRAYFYVAPAIVGMVVLVFFPFIYGIALSFTDANIYNTNQSVAETWIGLRNYFSILGDFAIARRGDDGSLVFNYLNFYWTFLYTLGWTVSNVTIGVTVGLLLALVLNTKGLALRPVYRVLLILPWAMPNYITALIWKGMFHQQFGVINQMIQMFGGSPLSWFEKPFTSFLTALATNGWLSFPFMMVVSLGALQSIPGELYEAARVDGASRWQQFRAITLPSLKPALVPAIILSVVWTFNMFNIVYLVTQGEPAGSTEILITQAYKFAFEKYRYGYAAAYSTVMFGILLIYGNIQNRLTRATEAA
jgi:arabinogalactan oligomer / maltooligosaccharide transport system permease protein